MSKPEGFYLGDGAYVRPDDYSGGLVLYTHNGIHPTNSVYLERNVEAALYEYLKRRSE